MTITRKTVNNTKATGKATDKKSGRTIGTVKKGIKVKATQVDDEFAGFDDTEVSVKASKPKAKAGQDGKQFALKDAASADFGRIMLIALTELTNGVSAKELIDRLTNEVGPVKTQKTQKAPKESVKNSNGNFEKVTRAFGYMLRREHDTAALKAEFKEALAKYPDSGATLSNFNKIYNGQFIVAGLVKRKGEYMYTGFDSKGKRASAPV